MTWNPFLEAVRRAVYRSGLSNTEIERRSGVNHSVVGRMLSGERVPTRPSFNRILDVLPNLEEGEAEKLRILRKQAEQMRGRVTDEAVPIVPAKIVKMEA